MIRIFYKLILISILIGTFFSKDAFCMEVVQGDVFQLGDIKDVLQATVQIDNFGVMKGAFCMEVDQDDAAFQCYEVGGIKEDLQAIIDDASVQIDNWGAITASIFDCVKGDLNSCITLDCLVTFLCESVELDECDRENIALRIQERYANNFFSEVRVFAEDPLNLIPVMEKLYPTIDLKPTLVMLVGEIKCELNADLKSNNLVPYINAALYLIDNRGLTVMRRWTTEESRKPNYLARLDKAAQCRDGADRENILRFKRILEQA